MSDRSKSGISGKGGVTPNGFDSMESDVQDFIR